MVCVVNEYVNKCLILKEIVLSVDEIVGMKNFECNFFFMYSLLVKVVDFFGKRLGNILLMISFLLGVWKRSLFNNFLNLLYLVGKLNKNIFFKRLKLNEGKDIFEMMRNFLNGLIYLGMKELVFFYCLSLFFF